MKASEILRKLADLIDQNSGGNFDEPSKMSQDVEFTPVEVDNEDDTEVSVMIPPLQQKLELLKKVAGPEDEESNELEIMKRRAGINPYVVYTAGEDNDVLD
jgi:hypothetical protein